MKNAIILHGLPSKSEYYSDIYPSASNSHWLPWLQKQLLMNDVKADTPEIPHVYRPDYSSYVREVERFDITSDTTLVGHSMGAGFWVRYLSEHPEITVDKVALVAPWIDPFREDTTDFFEFEIDKDMAKRTNGIWIFNSDTDSNGVHTSIETIRSTIDNVLYKEFHEYGHFTSKGMGTNKFPELLEVIIQ